MENLNSGTQIKVKYAYFLAPKGLRQKLCSLSYLNRSKTVQKRELFWCKSVHVVLPSNPQSNHIRHRWNHLTGFLTFLHPVKFEPIIPQLLFWYSIKQYFNMWSKLIVQQARLPLCSAFLQPTPKLVPLKRFQSVSQQNEAAASTR